jgi:hypothetical protein
MRQTNLVLSADDRKTVEELTSKGQHNSREFKRAISYQV